MLSLGEAGNTPMLGFADWAKRGTGYSVGETALSNHHSDLTQRAHNRYTS